MGARAQVHMEESGVYLYTHWGSGTLKKDVARALKKKWRWDDVEYLTRIIFDEMVGKEQGEETGYGIGTNVAGDAEYIIHISNNLITVTGYSLWTGTFDEFIKQFS